MKFCIEYPNTMDKECINLCNVLNSLPDVKTFESCCGHLKDRYSIWFFCTNIDTISRLGRTISHNYSDGKWELLVDSTDIQPVGVFWLRSITNFKSYDEMNVSINNFIDSIHYWFDHKFDNHFKIKNH